MTEEERMIDLNEKQIEFLHEIFQANFKTLFEQIKYVEFFAQSFNVLFS